MQGVPTKVPHWRMAPSGLSYKWLKGLEARGGIEPPIKVLQTFALPLGDRASVQTHSTRLEPGIAFIAWLQ
jgi:hypothetical protein